MKIANSSLYFSSERSYQESTLQKASLTLIQARKQADGSAILSSDTSGKENSHLPSGIRDSVQLSKAHSGRHHSHHHIADAVSEEDIPDAELNIRILAEMVRRITGKVLSVRVPQGNSTSVDSSAANTQNPQATQTTETAPPESGILFEYSSTHYESEQTSFSAQGTVQTADGQSIDISVALTMSREFASQQNITLKSGAALKDPLVINFSGNAVELTQRDFSFDIDADGQKDQIAFTGANSGFLALDSNNDGTINNGSELFGALTGDGFSELSKFDSDGNGWIDESDPVYANLRIWTKDANGNDSLFALGEKGIGAIYLNHMTTQFSLNNSANEVLGQVKSSGIFLYENGLPGTIQQIDLAV